FPYGRTNSGPSGCCASIRYRGHCQTRSRASRGRAGVQDVEAKAIADRHERDGFKLLAELTPLQRMLGMHVIEKYPLDFHGIHRGECVGTVLGEITTGERSHILFSIHSPCPQEVTMSRKHKASWQMGASIGNFEKTTISIEQ